MKLTTEGKAKFYADLREKISREMEVFYNPVMSFNRDVSVKILNSKWLAPKRPLRVGLPMAGTGVRGLRILSEVDKERIDSVTFNDIDDDAVSAIKKNLEVSGVDALRAKVSQSDATHFLLDDCGYDYVDIDPFGSPNRFLDACLKRVARNGIVAVTATDTAGPCGSYPKVGFRKYWGKPLKTEHMHELGLRLMIRKIQLVGMQYDRGLIPVFCYYRNHYFRAFFVAKKTKTDADSMAKEMGYYLYCRKCGAHSTSKDIFNDPSCSCGGKKEWAGPMFLGPLFDKELVSEICAGEKGTLGAIFEEANLDFPFFYGMGSIAKANVVPHMKRKNVIIAALRKKGFAAGPTHFNANAVKTNAGIRDFLNVLK